MPKKRAVAGSGGCKQKARRRLAKEGARSGAKGKPPQADAEPLLVRRAFWRGEAPADPPSDELKSTRQRLGIKLRGAGVPAPAETFADPGFPPEFETYFKGAKGSQLTAPTTIQTQAWPAALCGLDLIGIAPTGSGKTLTYLLPVVPHICAQLQAEDAGKGDGPSALVLVPTRELAQQVCGPFRGQGGLTKLFGLRSFAIVGGVDKQTQVDELLAEGVPHVVVATPGRLLDLVSSSALRLESVTFLVLDEADRMLALGFEKQLDELAKVVRLDRQTLLFSATFPLKVRQAAERWLSPQHVLIRVAALEVDHGAAPDALGDGGDEEAPDMKGTLTVNPLIKQTVHVCASHKKPQKLAKFLEKIRGEEKQKGVRQKASMLIFCNKIKTVIFVVDFLAQASENERCTALHSQLSQAQREQALWEFKAGRSSILIATDVAARGLHDKRLKYVINYDFPSNLEQYCHRIGRTGRSGEEGFAYSFFTRNLAPLAKDLISILGRTGSYVDPNLHELVSDTGGGDCGQVDEMCDQDDVYKGAPDAHDVEEPSAAAKKRKKRRAKAAAEAKQEQPGSSKKASKQRANNDSDHSSDFGAVSGRGLRLKPRKRGRSVSSSDHSQGDDGHEAVAASPRAPTQARQQRTKVADFAGDEDADTGKEPFKRQRGKRGGKKNSKWW
mmetsp:Transcript_50477/g.163390  ORF Transcript_50477/g.163390 Transcript_50477/m.163390 type:complete len:670 (+) Transcript_50477:60-2069(+)